MKAEENQVNFLSCSFSSKFEFKILTFKLIKKHCRYESMTRLTTYSLVAQFIGLQWLCRLITERQCYIQQKSAVVLIYFVKTGSSLAHPLVAYETSYCLILNNTCICWYSTCTCIMNVFKFRYTLVYILNRKYCTYTYVTFYYHLYALIIRIIIPDILIWTIRNFCLNYCFCIKLIGTLLKGYEANILDRWLGFVSVFLVLVLVMCNVKPLF